MTESPLIYWVRRDLRLSDHPALTAAVATGRPVVPLFILDAETEALGAAAKWRLGLGPETCESVGSRVVTSERSMESSVGLSSGMGACQRVSFEKAAAE